MRMEQFIYPLKRRRIPTSFGQKAHNLGVLQKLGARIPVTYVCTWNAYQHYLQNDVELIRVLQGQLTRIISLEKKYAVRSSASIEDGVEHSFAGQFKSALNVVGPDNVLQAIWSVWSSALSSGVQAYLERSKLPGEDLKMAVIIQEMVEPMFSGVALSRNPVTGGNETIIEAVQGEGTRLVQAGLTPDRWVNYFGHWREKPVLSDMPFSVVQQIADEVRRISAELDYPVDMEWVYDGKQLYWVQLRRITAFRARNVYSNHIPREMLAGMIKPLIFSVNIPMVNGTWIRLLEEITGKLDIQPADLAKSFYYRVYFNMGVLGRIFKELGFPAESVEMLMGILPRGGNRMRMRPSSKTISHLPRFLLFFLDKWRFGSRIKVALVRLEPKIRSTPIKGLENWSKEALVKGLDQLSKLMVELTYYNVMGPLLMMMYNRVLKNQLSGMNIDINEVDITENMPALHDFDPALFLGQLHEHYQAFPRETREKIELADFASLDNLPGIEDFRTEVSAFIDHFGHLSVNGNDFSAIPWRETPDLVMRMIVDFKPQTEKSKRKVRLADHPGFKRTGVFVNLMYRRAREFLFLRERVSSLYTYGYGLFRYYYLALGNHLVEEGILDGQEDIFYLTKEQVMDLVSGIPISQDVRKLVNQHKGDLKRYESIDLPTVIFGDEIPPIRNVGERFLVGVPASIGQYTGPARVVRSIQDFSKVKPGDVLVIPYSEVSWTPLFARAGAVVAESGGLLSHSSIVAREYNIPAVVSVDGATQLQDGIQITVDGHKGEVIILGN